jgi:hypothetical protein
MPVQNSDRVIVLAVGGVILSYRHRTAEHGRSPSRRAADRQGPFAVLAVIRFEMYLAQALGCAQEPESDHRPLDMGWRSP